MSERFKATLNVNDSKNTRLPIAEEFHNYRFGRDALAHVSRYLWICEQLVALSREHGPLEILDVGCGDVYVARTLQASLRVPKAEVVERYVGFDLDDRSLARTAQTKPKAINIDLVCGDVTTGDLWQFNEAEFDVLICTEVLEHIKPEFVPDVLQAFAHATRHVAFISTPNFAGGSGRLPKDHVLEWNADDLAPEIERAGFTIREEFGTFCQLKNAAELAKQDEFVGAVWNALRGRMDKHLLSLVMARLLGRAAQNVLYVCEPK